MLKFLLPFIISLTFLGCTDNEGTNSQPIIESAPKLQELSLNVPENISAGRIIGSIQILDSGSGQISQIVLTGTGNEKFSASINGDIKLADSQTLDYETTTYYKLEAIATNYIGNSQPVAVIINIENIDEVAILDTFEGFVSEDAVSAVEIGKVGILSIGDSIITSMELEGEGHENFTITVDGTIYTDTNLSLDYETLSEYNLTAYAINHGGKSLGSDVSIKVLNVPDQLAVLEDTLLNVDENSSQETPLGTLNFLVKGDSNITSFSLNGDDNDTFSISSDGEVLLQKDASLDYETKNFYSFTVSVTNTTGTSNSVDLNISINDIPDVVPTLSNTELSIEENSLASTLVGSVIIDNAGDSPITSFTISGEGKENFTISDDAKIVVSDNANLDFEEISKYSLEVSATNTAGESETVSLTINITDVENPFQIAKIQAEDSDKDDNYGQSVAISNEYMVVGTPLNDNKAKDAGTIYLLKKSDNDVITQIDSIEADDAEENDQFGYSIAIYNEYIVVGAPKKNINGDQEGYAYLFKIVDDKLKQIAKFHADDADDYDHFGNSIAINGDYIIVGASEEDSGDTNDAGSSYLFKIDSDDNVDQIKKIHADTQTENAYFGQSVTIDNNYVVVGASGVESNTGAAYLFKITDDDITQTDKIEASDRESDDYFATSLDIYNNYIIIGAPGEDTNHKGSAYFYEIKSDDTVDELTKIQADDAQDEANFGNSVAISQNYVTIGAYQDDATLTDTGSAYLFKLDSNNNLTQIKKMVARYNHAYDKFANSIDIFKNIIVVGGKLDDTLASNGGSTYIFNIEPIDKPYIYNVPKYKKVNEEISYTKIQTIDAQRPNGGTIYFAVEGDDADLFTIKDTELSFIEPINYEDKADANGDNSFDITVVASTEIGNSDTKHTYITVKDLNYLTLATIQAKYKAEDDNFTNSVSVNANYILVGAPYQDDTANNAGAAYLFKKQTDNNHITQVALIQADDAQADDNFGTSVSIYGDYLVVGAPKADTNGTDSGSVYLFKKDPEDDENEYTQLAHITADDAEASDQFGYSVKIDANYIIVGAPFEDTTQTDAGSAYLFKFDDDGKVTQLAKFQADDAGSDDAFASALSIDGDYISVGALYNDDNGTNSGSAYLFKRESDDENNVTQKAKFLADDADSEDIFGKSIDISGNYIIVGAPENNTSEGAEGKAYLFKRDADDNVAQISSFQADDVLKDDNFASAIAIDDDYIVVGSINCDTIDNDYITKIDSGCSYTFERTSDTESGVKLIEKSQARVPQIDSKFGNAVDIDGDLTVVGANETDTATGQLTIFIKDND